MKCKLLGAAFFGALLCAPVMQAQAGLYEFTSIKCSDILESQDALVGGVAMFDGFLSGIYQNVDGSSLDEFAETLASACSEDPSQTVWSVIEANEISK